MFQLFSEIGTLPFARRFVYHLDPGRRRDRVSDFEACDLETPPRGSKRATQHFDSRSGSSVWAVTLVLISLLCSVRYVTAQAPNSPNNDLQVKNQEKTDGQGQLSPEQQRWCSTIDSALEEAQSLQLGMKAFVLERIADGLVTCRPRKAPAVLSDAFFATLAISDNQQDIKNELQTSILKKLLSVQEKNAETLLSQADPNVQRVLASDRIASAISRKDFDRALALMEQVPPDGTYPYELGTQIMLGLPRERTADREAIFAQATASYRKSHLRCTECDGFPKMIQACWHQLPPSEVIDAIHEVIDAAENDSGPIESGKSRFDSEYDYRLSELLPILRELAPDEADRIVSSSKSTLTGSPQPTNQPVGQSSSKQGEVQNAEPLNVGTQHQTSSNTTVQSNTDLQRIIEIAKRDPLQAIAVASVLPLSVQYHRRYFDLTGFLAPRAEAFLSIARVASKDDPPAALEALSEMAKSFDKGDPDIQMEYCLEGMGMAKQLAAPDLAHQLLDAGFDQVERLKAIDTDANNPNTAPKFWWPSATAATRLVIAASAISNSLALQSTGKVDDPEICLLLKVRLANHQLGKTERITTKMMRNKEGWTTTMGSNL